MTGIASRSQLRMSFLRIALFTVPLILLLGMLSAWISGSGYENPWFDALAKPSYMPPGGTFAAAWTILYILIGTALAIILFAKGAAGRGRAVALFAGQFALALVWSPLFFAAHQVGPAFWLLLAILTAAAITTVLFARIRKAAGLLMLPYLAWMCFAAVLNHDIDRLNPEAETLAPGGGSAEIRL